MKKIIKKVYILIICILTIMVPLEVDATSISLNKSQILLDVGYSETLKYTIEDMCCEYCYKNLVYELFVNEFVKSVKSNFDFNKPAFNIEFIIEYDQNYKEDDLIKYINNVQ